MSSFFEGSDEEKEDLKKLYQRFQGNMNIIMEHLMFYQFEHEGRYRDIIAALIDKKEVPDYKIFTAESSNSVAARKKKVGEKGFCYCSVIWLIGASVRLIDWLIDCLALCRCFVSYFSFLSVPFQCEAEAKSAEKAAAKKQKNGAGDGNDLIKMIQARQKNRMDNLVDSLTSRHGGKAPMENTASDDEDWEGVSGDDVGKSDSDETASDDEEEEKPTFSGEW